MEIILIMPLMIILVIGLVLLLIVAKIVIRDQWRKWRFFRRQSQAAPRQEGKQ